MPTTHMTAEPVPSFSFRYIETTIPAGVTMSEYRRARPRRPTRWQRLKQLAATFTAPTASVAGTG